MCAVEPSGVAKRPTSMTQERALWVARPRVLQQEGRQNHGMQMRIVHVPVGWKWSPQENFGFGGGWLRYNWKHVIMKRLVTVMECNAERDVKNVSFMPLCFRHCTVFCLKSKLMFLNWRRSRSDQQWHKEHVQKHWLLSTVTICCWCAQVWSAVAPEHFRIY